MNDIDIGIMLRNARFEQDLTQQEVADALGVSLWTYNRLENGRRHFDEAWIERLPDGLRQPIIQYMEGRLAARLAFLRRVSEPVEPEPVPVKALTGFKRGDTPAAVVAQRPRFVRGDARAAA